MMHQMFSIGERSGLQAGQFSTWTLLLRSHAVVIAAAHTVCTYALNAVECQIWTHLTIDHFSTLKQSILNEPWPTGQDSASGPCSHMASFLHDRALVGICR